MEKHNRVTISRCPDSFIKMYFLKFENSTNHSLTSSHTHKHKKKSQAVTLQAPIQPLVIQSSYPLKSV